VLQPLPLTQTSVLQKETKYQTKSSVKHTANGSLFHSRSLQSSGIK